MDEKTSLFFQPRRVEWVQGRLHFLRVPPTRTVAFTGEADTFVGTRLHWRGGESVLCEGIEKCPHCAQTKPDDYYFAGVYMWAPGGVWRPFILPIGGDLSDYFQTSLVKTPLRIGERVGIKNKKIGTRIIPWESHEMVPFRPEDLKPVDVLPRIKARYHVS